MERKFNGHKINKTKKREKNTFVQQMTISKIRNKVYFFHQRAKI